MSGRAPNFGQGGAADLATTSNDAGTNELQPMDSNYHVSGGSSLRKMIESSHPE